MEAPRELPCPRCNAALDTEQAASHYGSRIEVDRCARCGGVFTSWGRILALSPQVVAEWDDRVALEPTRTSDLVRQSFPCPACKTELTRVLGKDLPPNLKVPADLELRLCDRGDGFWIDAAALSRFKEAQSSNLERKRADYARELEGRRSRQPVRTVALGDDREPTLRRAYSSLVVFLLFLILAALVGTTLLRNYAP
ncbi:MAG: zf-TFIIB domain-containing protein [bacterium]